jgi:serine protease Do
MPGCMRAHLLVFAFALLGCGGRSGPAAPAARTTSCASVTADLTSFGEALETSSVDAKTRVVTYAGLLELLLSFEGAASELDAELGALRVSNGELESRLKNARGALGRSAQFARSERDTVEKHAHEIAPLAKETQQAWGALRLACEGKKGPPDCGAVRDVLARFDAAETSEQHERAVADLVVLKLPSPTLAKSRDRAVTASKAVQSAIKSHTETGAMPKRWAGIQKELSSAMDGLIDACKGEMPPPVPLAAAARPDPRKLTVLVHVKPPAAVERSLLALAQATRDEDERAFYQARAEGAFGSGFFLVPKTEKGSDVLIVTNRHVVELGDRAALELADGTSLGAAEIVYSSPIHDLAVLRPSTKVNVSEGFAFALAPAKDQQTVIATGFPGLVGRPSYQTTRGYVSNQSFRLDDGSRPLTYVQHTAPIDPGSSGGPLTDESGRVLGVNTLKVTGREAVGLAVPSRYVLDTIRVAASVESHHGSLQNRQKSARLACLGFLAELGATEPRMLVLEQMISNHLVGVEGLDAAAALGSEEGFEHLWNTDSVRAMRIATLVKVRAAVVAGGGPSVFETCDDVDGASVRADHVKYRVRLGNFEARDLTLRWEHGRWKIDGFSAGVAPVRVGAPKKLPPPGPPAGAVPPKKGVPPPRSKK